MGVRLPFGYDHSRYYGASADLLVFYAHYQATAANTPGRAAASCRTTWGCSTCSGTSTNGCMIGMMSTRPGHHGSYDDSINDREYINEKTPRLLRGGSFGFLRADVRSACRGGGAQRTGTHTSAFAPPGRTTELPDIFAPSAFLILVFMREYTTMYSSTLTRSSRVVPRNRLSLLNWRENMR